MNLGFHYHVPMLQTLDGKIKTPGFQGRFLDSLANNCDNLICFLHSSLEDEHEQMDYVIQSSNIQWIDIGPHVSVPRRVLQAHRIAEMIRQAKVSLDVLLIRGPSPLLPAMAKANEYLPIVLLIVGDYITGINDLPQPRWRKEAIRAWSYWNFHQQMAIARHSLTIVNSRELYDKFRSSVPQLCETRTTTIRVDDFFYRDDTCKSLPIRLLYAGRMDRTKGLFEIVEAVDILAHQGIDIVLDLVGWPQRDDSIIDELTNFAHAKGIGERVHYHGYKPVGPQLFAYYRKADIYIIASYAEGFPRTIWEAMANSMPVVATKVGGIPNQLENERDALLVEPRNAALLADACLTLIVNDSLRQKLIRTGRTLTHNNTLDKRVKEMIETIQNWVWGLKQ